MWSGTSRLRSSSAWLSGTPRLLSPPSVRTTTPARGDAAEVREDAVQRGREVRRTAFGWDVLEAVGALGFFAEGVVADLERLVQRWQQAVFVLAKEHLPDVRRARLAERAIRQRHACRGVNEDGDELLVRHDVRRDEDGLEKRNEEEAQRRNPEPEREGFGAVRRIEPRRAVDDHEPDDQHDERHSEDVHERPGLQADIALSKLRTAKLEQPLEHLRSVDCRMSRDDWGEWGETLDA